MSILLKMSSSRIFSMFIFCILMLFELRVIDFFMFNLLMDKLFPLKLLDHSRVLLMNHFSIKFPKLSQHCSILFFSEVNPSCRKENIIGSSLFCMGNLSEISKTIFEMSTILA